MEKLRRSIQEVRVQNVDKRSFVPHGALSSVLSETAIREALTGRIKHHELSETVSSVLDGARKIFAILVMNSRPELIRNFLEHDQFSDSAVDNGLPFGEDTLVEILRDEFEAKQFYLKQWEFSVPMFTGRVIPRSLDSNVILPFMRQDQVGRGAFTTVYEIEIESSHQTFAGLGHRTYVRKEIDAAGSNQENELDNLSTLRHLHHPNIIKLLGAYTYFGKRNFIFPLAAGGDLRKLFQNERPEDFPTVETFFWALHGLASALTSVHSFRSEDLGLSRIGWHHNIAPPNILVEGSSFILADFGLSRLKDGDAESTSMWRKGQGYYQAPECQDLDEPFERHSVTRASDVWSMGCLIADVLSYIMKGPRGVEAFEERRRFRKGSFNYFLFHQGTEPSDTVESWLAELDVEASESESMLISLTKRILLMNPRMRPKAQELTDALGFIALYEVTEQVSHTLNVLQDEVKEEGGIPEIVAWNSWRRTAGFDDYQDFKSMEDVAAVLRIDFDRTLAALNKIREFVTAVTRADKGILRRLTPLRLGLAQLFQRLPPLQQRPVRNPPLVVGRSPPD